MPRKPLPLIGSRTGKRSFNEAGAIMPRKQLRQYVSEPHPLCFNEAGAIMPRKRVMNVFFIWSQLRLQ